MGMIAVILALHCTLTVATVSTHQEAAPKSWIDLEAIPEHLLARVPESDWLTIQRALNEWFGDLASEAGPVRNVEPENEPATRILIREIRELPWRAAEDGTVVSRVVINDCQEFAGRLFIFRLHALSNTGDLLAMWSLRLRLHSDETVTFASPIGERTRHWQRSTVDLIEYHYQGVLEETVGKAFAAKNREFAEKFQVEPKHLIYYRCAGFQEALWILGIDYLREFSGTNQSSDGHENVIFTGADTEDFAHDLLHMYVADLERPGRSRIVEEGLATTLGNAYWTKWDGSIVEQHDLLNCLAGYLDRNPEESLLRLFQDDTPVFASLREQVPFEIYGRLSVRNAISSLFCQELEERSGFAAVLDFDHCGKSEEEFMIALEQHLGITEESFDEEVRRLLEKFHSR